METLFPALATVGSVLALVVCGWLASRSMPAALAARVDRAEGAVERIDGEWSATKVHLAALEEELTALAESVERKRKRIAASASKMAAPEENEMDPRMALRRRAGLA